MKIKRIISYFLILSALCAQSAAFCASKAETAEPPAIEQTDDSKGNIPAESSQATPTYEGAFIKMLVTLIAILIFIFIAFWMVRRMSQGRLLSGNYNRTIKVLEKRPLSSKSMLYLIEYEGKKILIAESQLEVRLLAPIDEDVPTD